MGNTQGHMETLADGTHWPRQHAPLAISGPPVAVPTDTSLVASSKNRKIGGRRKGKAVAVRVTTEETTKSKDAVALYSNLIREADERAVKAEAGRMRASMQGGEWKTKYEEAVDQIKELERKTKEDEKAIGILNQSVASLKKKLSVERGQRRQEQRAKMSLSQSSLSSLSSGPPKKRSRPREATAAHSTSTESMGSTSSEGTLTVPMAQFTEVFEQREKLRAILARFGVEDESDFEDVKPDINPKVVPGPVELVQQLKNSEDTNRELRGMLDWYKKRLAEVSADFERLSLAATSRQLLSPISPSLSSPLTPNHTPRPFFS